MAFKPPLNAPIYIALVHHPCLDRAGSVVTTAVTNLDIHDMARSARTYGASGFFVVTPVEAQQQLVLRILAHWRGGAGARRIPERSRALELVTVVASLDEAVQRVRSAHGEVPTTVATSAKAGNRCASYREIAGELRRRRPVLLIFGTGYGLSPALIDRADRLLAPIRPAADFNHLSVRSAAAITLDRLVDDDWA